MEGCGVVRVEADGPGIQDREGERRRVALPGPPPAERLKCEE